MNPRVRLCVRRQHSQFWPILTRFVDYYSLFWGPGVISTINEPLSEFTCRSSIILGLSDSGLFHGLLLTVLGSQNAFHGCRTPRCAYVLVVKTHSLGRFWPVSWTITQFRGSEVISRIDEIRGVFTCRSSTLTVFADSGQFRGVLLTILGSRSDLRD